jgi:hypothetical protein
LSTALLRAALCTGDRQERIRLSSLAELASLVQRHAPIVHQAITRAHAADSGFAELRSLLKSHLDLTRGVASLFGRRR